MRPRRHAVLTLSFIVGTAALSPSRLAAQSASELLRQCYEVDSQHSTIEFVTRMLGLVKVRGRFTQYSASIVYDTAAPERSSVSAIINVASLTTDMSFRDKHLKSPDFFDAARFPTIAFRSDRVERATDGLAVHGSLTMHGITRPVTMAVRIDLPPTRDAESDQLSTAFEAQVRISQRDFGIAGTNKYNPDYSPSHTLLSDSVDVILELSAQREGYLNRRFAPRTPRWIADTLDKTLAASGIDSTVRLYHALHQSQPNAYNFKPFQLDALARKVLARGHPRDALELFKLNAEMFPMSSGVVQGLADGYALLGDRDHALTTYARALQLDSTNTSAIEMMRHLGK
jgi:polyisoprenoid-binding protein YceI